MSWREEFDEGYAIPEEFEALVLREILADKSHSGDTCPHFERQIGERDGEPLLLEVWFERPDRFLRDSNFDQGIHYRFHVRTSDPAGTDAESLLYSDDAKTVLEYLMAYLNSLAVAPHQDAAKIADAYLALGYLSDAVRRLLAKASPESPEVQTLTEALATFDAGGGMGQDRVFLCLTHEEACDLLMATDSLIRSVGVPRFDPAKQQMEIIRNISREIERQLPKAATGTKQ